MSLIGEPVSLREARMMRATPGDAIEVFGGRRRCDADGCAAVLSRYNPGSRCGAHDGWRAAPGTRRRR